MNQPANANQASAADVAKAVMKNLEEASLNDDLVEYEERPHTDMETSTGKNDRFSRSREAKEEFVNRIAELMVEMGKENPEWHQGWKSVNFPYCAATGRPYSGLNAMMLMLTASLVGYQDDRWMTFKQMNAIKEKDPENLKNMHIRKGEKGITLLRPSPVFYIVDSETGKWIFLKEEQIQEIKKKNQALPEDKQAKIFSFILYQRFTVFNAAQIEGFPVEENPKEENISPIARNEMLERFFASSGVEIRHSGLQPRFVPSENTVYMPLPADFESEEEYYATKLHEFFHATGHEKRENRLEWNSKKYAFEEMRAEIFSAMTAAHLGLPMHMENHAAYIENWNRKFSGGDAQAVFAAAKDASKILTVLAQFENQEQPDRPWFPTKEMWPTLIEAQKARDEEDNVAFAVCPEEEEAGFDFKP